MADAEPQQRPVAADATPVTEVSASAPEAAPADEPKDNSKRKRLFAIFGLIVLVAALLYGAYYLIFQRGRVHTDNAYVGADSAQITPLVAGPVAQVRVSNTQTVQAGDILVVLDDSDAKVDVATAEAALAQAKQKFGQASATVASAGGKLEARDADIAQARARLAQAVTDTAKARGDFQRRRSLQGTGAVSGEEVASARAALEAAQAMQATAAAAVKTAQANRSSAVGDLEAQAALVRGTNINTAPDVAAAKARLDSARLNLARTVIRAPIGGVVTNKMVQVGQRLAAGAPIMTIVPTSSVYVDANFKESQFTRIRIGQPVEVTSDFYGSDVVFHGKVIGLAGGTGAAFALIPAQNATGNWIKVVQRLPVRVALEPAEMKDHPLRVGLSMDAVIDTRGN
jgi:membrane fusion protein (multidrug efflux system)